MVTPFKVFFFLHVLGWIGLLFRLLFCFSLADCWTHGLLHSSQVLCYWRILLTWCRFLKCVLDFSSEAIWTSDLLARRFVLINLILLLIIALFRFSMISWFAFGRVHLFTNVFLLNLQIYWCDLYIPCLIFMFRAQ